MKQNKQTYSDFCKQFNLDPTSRDSARAWVEDSLSADEVKRHYDDLFLSSLHPDGGNTAGFHGVGETNEV